MRTKINGSLHTGIECELDEQLPRAKVDGKDVEVYNFDRPGASMASFFQVTIFIPGRSNPVFSSLVVF